MNAPRHRHQRVIGARHMSGFSLVEVMVAVLVLGLGLLGFALLQTMSVRFTQSANHRTQATNLAYDMLDQIRVNRLAVGQYVGGYNATAAAFDTFKLAIGAWVGRRTSSSHPSRIKRRIPGPSAPRTNKARSGRVTSCRLRSPRSSRPYTVNPASFTCSMDRAKLVS